MNRPCPTCEEYMERGHNYCRMCGFHVRKVMCGTRGLLWLTTRTKSSVATVEDRSMNANASVPNNEQCYCNKRWFV